MNYCDVCHEHHSRVEWCSPIVLVREVTWLRESHDRALVEGRDSYAEQRRMKDCLTEAMPFLQQVLDDAPDEEESNTRLATLIASIKRELR